MAREIIGYNVYYAPDGCDEEFVGQADTLAEARKMTGRGLARCDYATADAAGHVAGMTSPDKTNEADEAAAWFGPDGWHCAVPVYAGPVDSRRDDDDEAARADSDVLC